MKKMILSITSIVLGASLLFIPGRNAQAATLSVSTCGNSNAIENMAWDQFPWSKLFSFNPAAKSTEVKQAPEDDKTQVEAEKAPVSAPAENTKTPANAPTNTAAAPVKNTAAQSNMGQINAQEQEMVNLINEERAKAGVTPLTVDTELSKVARIKAQDMVDHGYFSHTSPTYGSPFDMMKSMGVQYKLAGENIAKNGSVQKAHVALMNSEGHRKNILNGSFTHVGVGIITDKNGNVTISQMFIGK